MSRSLPIALALAVLSLAVAAPAHAVLITVNFTVTSDPSDLALPAGTTSNGSFSFDSSLIPSGPGTLTSPPDLASAINFTWGGNTWTENGASLYSLTFASQGTWEVQPGLFLTDWALAGDIFGTGLANLTADFLVKPSNASPFVYTFGGGPRTGTLDSWSVSTSGAVPEPGTLALFAPGLLALGLIRRRRS